MCAGFGKLPRGDADSPDGPDETVKVPSDWPGFDEFEFYSEVYDPYSSDPPGTGSLSDDFLDIYRDLRRGLAVYEGGNAGGAVWEWRFHFQSHWGIHAASAQRALHRACLLLELKV